MTAEGRFSGTVADAPVLWRIKRARAEAAGQQRQPEVHALQTSPFELLTHLAAASQGELLLSSADLFLTTCSCKDLKCGSFFSSASSLSEHLFWFQIPLTFPFSSSVHRCLAPTCRLPSAPARLSPQCLLCFFPLSLLPGGSTTTLSQVALPRAYLLRLLLQS